MKTLFPDKVTFMGKRLRHQHLLGGTIRPIALVANVFHLNTNELLVVIDQDLFPRIFFVLHLWQD